MKKLFLSLTVALLTATAVQAQQKIAVLDFKAGAGISQVDVDGISAIFGTYFIDPSSFTLVERTQIDRVITEQGFQQSSLTQQQMVRVGQILNLSKIVVGDVNIVGGQYNLDVRVVDVQSGAVNATDGATWAQGSSYRTLMSGLAGRLKAKMFPPTSGAPAPSAQPRAQMPTTVVTLLGFLHVYPGELGEFPSMPSTVIAQLNQQGMHGYNDWRVPTAEELALMKANAAQIGLGAGNYMTSDGTRSGIVRLVTTGQTVAAKEAARIAEAARLEAERQRQAEEARIRVAEQQRQAEEARVRAEQQRQLEAERKAEAQRLAAEQNRTGVLINGVWWATRNIRGYGSFVANPEDYGSMYTFEEAQTICPSGWRLPTPAEINLLLSAPREEVTINGVRGCKYGSGSDVIFIPYVGYRDERGGYVEFQGSRGWYWSSQQFNKYFGYSLDVHQRESRYDANYLNRGYGVRCVRQ